MTPHKGGKVWRKTLRRESRPQRQGRVTRRQAVRR